MPHLEDVSAKVRPLNRLGFLLALGVSDEQEGTLAETNAKEERVVVRVAVVDEARTRREHVDARGAEHVRPADVARPSHRHAAGARLVEDRDGR